MLHQPLQVIKTEGSKVSREFRGRTISFISGAFGLVAGLAWNDAITELISYLFPTDRDSIRAKFIYAFLVTIVLVFISTYLVRLLGKKDDV